MRTAKLKLLGAGVAMHEYFKEIKDRTPELAVNFFAIFSRLEFALKRGGYVRSVGKKQAAEANWDKFATDLGTDFFTTVQAKGLAITLISQPPKRLIVNTVDQIEFLQERTPSSTLELFVAMRRVRNNLFHGEKPVIDERSKTLLQESLNVLDLAFTEAEKCEHMRKVCESFHYAEAPSRDGAEQ